MLLTISYIFKKAEEVTPLALQNMLYFIQGIYMFLFDDESVSGESSLLYSNLNSI